MGHKSLAAAYISHQANHKISSFLICYWPETGVCMVVICKSSSIRSCWEESSSEEEW